MGWERRFYPYINSAWGSRGKSLSSLQYNGVQQGTRSLLLLLLRAQFSFNSPFDFIFHLMDFLRALIGF